jgi:hypothetical protein
MHWESKIHKNVLLNYPPPPFFIAEGVVLLEWVSDYCLTPIQQFSAKSWPEKVNFQWYDDEVRFVLDRHA